MLPFIKLSVLQLKRLVPDVDILISDDPSPESPAIEALAKEHGCSYLGARVRRGHFASDFQSLVNSLAFAEAVGADVAVKVSQRFVFRKLESIEIFRKTFSDQNIMAATPGQPKVNGATRQTSGFGAFGTLSDVVAIRVGSITPENLIHLYRARLMREKVPWASFIECLVDELHTRVFPGKTVKIAELTNPENPADPIYLRRYQAGERLYHELAQSHGITAQFPLCEWAQIEQGNYLCRPILV